MEAVQRKYKHSIIREFSAVLLLVMVVALAMVFFVSHAISVNKTKSDIQNEAIYFLSELKEVLKHPLWSFNNKGLSISADAYFRNELVAALTIKNSEGETLFAREKPIKYSSYSLQDNIEYQGQTIGQIHLIVSSDYRENLEDNLMWSHIKASALMLLTTLVIAGLFLRFLLQNTFRRFTDTVVDYAGGNEKAFINNATHVEFSPLVELLQSLNIKTKRAEMEMKESLELRAKILNESPIGMSIYDSTGQCIEANNSIGEIIGATRDQVLAQNYNDIESWKKSGLFELAKSSVTDLENRRHEFSVTTSFGKEASFDCQFVPFTMGDDQRLLFMIDDISERKEAEEQIKKALTEKETLLKEVHHRVKNNMQIVSSLLFLQLRKISNPEAMSAIKESQDRIEAMALVHEKLYSSDHLSKINLDDYIRTLCQILMQSHTLSGSVDAKVDAKDIFLSVHKAIPFGLIINELTTNSLKHAFKDGRQGEIRIVLSRTDDRLMLTYCDNGSGLPAGYDENTVTTLGMTLIKNLARQLDASLEFQSNNGLKCLLAFSVDEKDKELPV